VKLPELHQDDMSNPEIKAIKAAMKANKDLRMHKRYQAVLMHLHNVSSKDISKLLSDVRFLLSITTLILITKVGLTVWRSDTLPGVRDSSHPNRNSKSIKPLSSRRLPMLAFRQDELDFTDHPKMDRAGIWHCLFRSWDSRTAVSVGTTVHNAYLYTRQGRSTQARSVRTRI
jgi:hypothetical protein